MSPAYRTAALGGNLRVVDAARKPRTARRMTKVRTSTITARIARAKTWVPTPDFAFSQAGRAAARRRAKETK